MMAPDGAEKVVSLCNSATREWLGHVGSEESFVLSGVGLWSVLAALTRGASGEALTELGIATGASPAEIPELLNALAAVLGGTPGVATALGLWAQQSVSLRDEYVSSLPMVTVESLPSDLSELDHWARRETNGMIDSFPANVTPDTLLVAASVVTAEADWVEPFDDATGTWQGSGRIPFLHWHSQDPSPASIVETEHTRIGRVICATESGFDVHLLTGDEGVEPRAVLAAGIDAAEGTGQIIPGSSLRQGDTAGCLTTRKIPTYWPGLSVYLPGFEVGSSWDLTAQPERFGLETATDSSRGHFDQMATAPLAVQRAGQQCVAGFSATGFRAAAVTDVFGRAGAGPPTETHTVVTMHLNRPFGFLVAHRETGLAMFAGWVAEVGTESPWG